MQVTGVLATRAANEQAGDTSTLDALLAGDFTAVGPLGFILPMQAWLARHHSRDLTYQAFSTEEVQDRPINPDAEIMTARPSSTPAAAASHRAKARHEHAGRPDSPGRRRSDPGCRQPATSAVPPCPQLRPWPPQSQ